MSPGQIDHVLMLQLMPCGLASCRTTNRAHAGPAIPCLSRCTCSLSHYKQWRPRKHLLFLIFVTCSRAKSEVPSPSCSAGRDLTVGGSWHGSPTSTSDSTWVTAESSKRYCHTWSFGRQEERGAKLIMYCWGQGRARYLARCRAA